MADLKLVFVLFFLCLISAQAQTYDLQVDEKSSIIDQIKFLVHNLEIIIDKAIMDITKFVNGVELHYEDYRSKLINIWEKVITTTLKSVTKTLNRIAETCTEPGKKLVKCFNKSAADLGAVPVTLLNKTTACNKEYVIKLAGSLKPLLKDFAEIQQEAKTVANKIDDCKGDAIQEIICAVQLGVDLIEVARKIPEKTKNDFPRFENDLKNLIETTIQCAKSNLDPNADHVLDTIGRCVEA